MVARCRTGDLALARAGEGATVLYMSLLDAGEGDAADLALCSKLSDMTSGRGEPPLGTALEAAAMIGFATGYCPEAPPNEALLPPENNIPGCDGA